MLTKPGTVAALGSTARPSRWQRYCKLGAFFLVTLYLALSPMVLYYFFAFRPVRVSSYEPEKAQIDRRDVFFKSKNGATLHAWYFRAPKAQYTVLLHHGQGANLSTFLETAHALVAAGANVLLYDYQGFGLSQGQPTNEIVCADAEAAYQYLLDTNLAKPQDIVECGLSLGTGIACRLAEQRTCAGLILVSPYKSLMKVAQFHLPFLRLYPSFTYPQPDLGVGSLFAKKTVPLLMMHAINDQLLPVQQADEIFQQASEPKVYIRIPGGHIHVGGLSEENSGDPGSAVSVCSDFLKSLPSHRPVRLTSRDQR